MKEVSTDSYEVKSKYKSALCEFDRCPALDQNDIKVLISREFEKRESKYETQKSIWTKLGTILLPSIISFFIYTANLDKRIAMLESQNYVIIEMRKEIKEISSRLHSIEILLARNNIENE